MALTDRRGTITEEEATPTFTNRRAGVTEGQAIKSACRVIATSAITLSGEQTIDGVACVEDDRVLVSAQASGIENGIYVVQTGNWYRAKDFDGHNDVVYGTRILVVAGTVNALTEWYVSTANPITIGTTSIAIVDLSSALLALDADIIAIGALAGTGVLTRTGANTWALATTSAALAAQVSDETGSGALVFGTSPGFTTAANPVSDDAATLGTAALRWSDLFLAEGGVINWDNGDVTITQANNVLSFAGAATRYEFDANLTPSASDGAALGTSALMFSDIFLASGGVVNFNNGDVTLTHSANVLAFGGAASGYTFTHAVLPSANDGAAIGASGTAWADVFLASGGVINWNAGDVTVTHSANALAFAGASSGYTFDAAITPAASDGAALGTSSVMWSDLFLASGSVINWNAGDITLTHSANLLAFAGASSGYSFDAVLSGTTMSLSSYAQLAEIASPSNPAADNLRIFAKDVGGSTHLFSRDSTGTEVDMTLGGGGASAATQAEMEAASSTSVYASPGRTQFHPGVAKGWAFVDTDGVLLAGHNLTSAKDSTGVYSLTIGTDMSSANYAIIATSQSGNSNAIANTLLAGSFKVETRITTTNVNDDSRFYVAIFGDQ